MERMSDFFTKRLDIYEEHMLSNIVGAREFYRFTAECLPAEMNTGVLDLGCGTGLELDEYFAINPSARIRGIDLSEKMLDVLKEKHKGKDLKLTVGSYFEVEFGEEMFDAAVSVESLHHFTKDEKIPLYGKLRKALRQGGYFVLTDYFATSDEEERKLRDEYNALKKAEDAKDGEIYHFDTPLTVLHETEALIEAGFERVEILKNWNATYTLKASK